MFYQLVTEALFLTCLTRPRAILEILSDLTRNVALLKMIEGSLQWKGLGVWGAACCAPTKTNSNQCWRMRGLAVGWGVEWDVDYGFEVYRGALFGGGAEFPLAEACMALASSCSSMPRTN